jgi:UDP-N-acetylmuramate--alanine ligase
MDRRNEIIGRYLQPGKQVHLVGIGGVSMRPLGLVLKEMGLIVTGSDRSSTKSTDELLAKVIPVRFGHYPENIEGACCVIRTAAVHDDNPEIMAAREAGIPVFERAQAWGCIMRDYRNAICVAGTHGKTSTTSMVAHILMAAETDPTIVIGGHLDLINACHRIGQGDTIVMESCEFCDSFLNFSPSLSVILNVDADHLDYFKTMDGVKRSFRAFAELSSNGILANGDDTNTVDTLKGLEYVSFGFAEHNRVRAVNVSANWRSFDVVCDGELYCHLELKVFGRHNTENALAAAGAAWMMGIPGKAVEEGLSTFHGARRRMEYRGTINGADFFDDFGHHPMELATTLDTVATMGYKRVILAFQPYTYTRTKELFEEFVEQLKRPDILVISDILGARETDTLGLSSTQIQDRIPGSYYCPGIADVAQKLKELAQPGDLIYTSGCGNLDLAMDLLFGRK